MTEFNRTIIHMPGTRLTPDTVLGRTLTKVEHIKAVAIVIQWQDETFSVDWSQMKVSELAMASKVLDINATREIDRQHEPPETDSVL